MKKIFYLHLLFSCFCFESVAALNKKTEFTSTITAIPPDFQQLMKAYTWHRGCPVLLQDLRYLSLSYWGFDGKRHQGVLIVNKALAKEVRDIFKFLYLNKFPIERMEPIERFKGRDDAALRANNTSAFNCREVTGHRGIFSQHSYGRAIDINSKINPYVKGKFILPKSGAAFIDRQQFYPGKITKNSLIVKLFKQYGWDWGGNWLDVQDYQHFEKRINGEKRNPYGYD